MRDAPKSHLRTENADPPSGKVGRVPLDAPAADRQRSAGAKASAIRYRRLFEPLPTDYGDGVKPGS